MIYNSKLLIECLKLECLPSHKLNLYYSTSSFGHNNPSFTDRIICNTATAAKSSTSVDTSNKRILIVDDEV